MLWPVFSYPARSRRLLAPLALLAVVAAAAHGAAPAESFVGRRMPNFVAADAAGAQRALGDWRDKRVVVLAFLSTGCPVANRYLPSLNELQAKYAGQAVQLVGIYSQPADGAAEMARHAADFKIGFPVLHDADQAICQAAGAQRTPDMVVLDSWGVIRYHGRVDDREGYDQRRAAATRADLEEAIGAVLENQPVAVPETAVAGCVITRKRPVPDKGSITYANRVAAIVGEKCQACHRPGSAAPFALLEAEDVVHWSAMIKQVVLEGRMPPWHADPRYGKFSNDRRLSQDEINALVDWVDDGAPLGEVAQAPPPRQFASDWTIGKPDVIFEMPQEVTVPAQGVVPYRYFETKTNFTEDVWISAAEARPGNRAVVHHIIAFHRQADDGESTARRLAQGGDNWIAGTAPGDMALILPPGTARMIPAGSTIVWQLHYTPTGKEEKDRSQLGLVFYKGPMPPEHSSVVKGIANPWFRIPPGAAHHEVRSRQGVPRDVMLYAFMPHMHLRGHDFEYRAHFPDGRVETLLSIPRYDFAWQSTYRLAEPLHLPKGTTIECTAHFDNSVANKANPNPQERVRWGDQTWEEMMIGYVDFAWANDERPANPAAQAAATTETNATAQR